MIVLIDMKFNEEQLLLETFSPKMHTEQDIYKKLIFKFIPGGLKPPLKQSSRWGSGGFNMLLTRYILLSNFQKKGDRIQNPPIGFWHGNGNLTYFNFSSHEKISFRYRCMWFI